MKFCGFTLRLLLICVTMSCYANACECVGCQTTYGRCGTAAAGGPSPPPSTTPPPAAQAATSAGGGNPPAPPPSAGPPPGPAPMAERGGQCGMPAAGAVCPQECCSSASFCGVDNAHCGAGCQPAFGVCGAAAVEGPTSTETTGSQVRAPVRGTMALLHLLSTCIGFDSLNTCSNTGFAKSSGFQYISFHCILLGFRMRSVCVRRYHVSANPIAQSKTITPNKTVSTCM